MAKKFEELRSRMSRESRATSEAKARTALAGIPLDDEDPGQTRSLSRDIQSVCPPPSESPERSLDDHT